MVCSVCHSDNITVLTDILDIPVFCNVLLKSRTEALKAPKGNIKLCSCNNCSHVFNASFKPEIMDYDQDYENSLHFSSVFNKYAENLADYIISKYNIRNKDIIDIGCGKGDFLNIICNRGNNKGTGFDKSYVPKHNDKNITFIQDFYSDKYLSYNAELILCRQVLEHIPKPGEFLNSFDKAIKSKDSSIVFFEVPNAMYTIESLGIWDLIYEHCSYFTAHSLYSLFNSYGYAVLDLKEQFSGQYLSIELSPDKSKSGNISVPVPDKSLFNKFKKEYESKIEYWQKVIASQKYEGKKIVVWSAGSKGVTFLNLVDPEGYINFVVDVSPQKQNLFVPGTGQQIISPDKLKEIKPDTVIIMNPVYELEIRNTLENIGVFCEILKA